MHNKYILSVAIILLIVCCLAGCTESNDSASSITGESSKLESSQSEEVTTLEADSQTEAITSNAAETIALNDLGITRNDVKYIHSYEEHDGGTIVAWCVEFEVNNTQYNYYVDMYTGEILKVYEETHN